MVVLYDLKGTEVLRSTTGLKGSVHKIVVAPVTEDLFFALLSTQNEMKIYNLTIMHDTPSRAGSQVKRPSSPAISLKVTDSRIVDLQSIIEEFADEDLPSDFAVKHAVTYVVRGVKYIVLADNDRHVTTLYRNMRVKNRFQLDVKEVNYFYQQGISIMFASKNAVGFVKIFERGTDEIYCEGGTAELFQIETDTS